MAKLLSNLASVQEELQTEAATIIVEIGFPAVPGAAVETANGRGTRQWAPLL